MVRISDSCSAKADERSDPDGDSSGTGIILRKP